VTVVAIAVAVVYRDDRVIVAVVEVLGCWRLIVVAVAVSDADKTAGFCDIASPAVRSQVYL
jgi:hypothetical protein